MVEHILEKHKRLLAKDVLVGPKRRPPNFIWYMMYGIIAMFFLAVLVNGLLSLPHVNTTLLTDGSIAVYVLFCILALSYALDRKNSPLESFMMGALGVIPGLIVETLFRESRGRHSIYYTTAIFLSWLSTVSIMFMLLSVFSFVVR